MNLLGTMMGGSTGGAGNMANLASSLVAQALQNKPGGMMIGGHSFGGGASSGNSGPSRGGYMDRRGGRDDYNVRFPFFEITITLLLMSGFVLDEKFQQNASKFAIFYLILYVRKPKVAFSIFHFVLLYCFP